jgi:hypothetical protein
VNAITVRGNATAEEVAAVLAVVSRAGTSAPADAYVRWRQARLTALRADTSDARSRR